MSDGSGEIIIKGGSCELYFDKTLFETDLSDPKRHARTHPTLKIRQILISGDHKFDSGDMPEGFKGQIKIICALDS